MHNVYKTKQVVGELQRISFTRFRVSGHNLAVETGRWNRRGRGRLPLEERLCVCGLVQTERQVLEICPRTHDIRQRYNINGLEELFSGDISYSRACAMVHKILETFQ